MTESRKVSGGKSVLGWWAWVGITLGAGVVGSILSDVSQSQFYQQLSQPSWAPPSSVFGPVWTTLFIMMGTAAWLVWRRRGTDDTRGPLILYLVHLLINAAWTGIFFGLEAPGAAFAEILLLWAVIAVLIVQFWKIDRIAGLLLVPYLAWVTFATALTWTLWRMNPGL